MTTGFVILLLTKWGCANLYLDRQDERLENVLGTGSGRGGKLNCKGKVYSVVESKIILTEMRKDQGIEDVDTFLSRGEKE